MQCERNYQLTQILGSGQRSFAGASLSPKITARIHALENEVSYRLQSSSS